jgi:hypothetical protein
MFGGFSKAEANRLASMDRYLGCYATAMVAVCAGIYYDYRASLPPRERAERTQAGRKVKRKKEAAERILTALLVLTMVLRPSPALVAPLAGKKASADFAQTAVKSCQSLLDPETDRVYLVQDKDSQRLFQFAYYLYPVRSNPAGQGKLNPDKLSAADLRKRLTEGGYTYLIIADYSEIFSRNYPALFDCPEEEIANGVLFRVDNSSGEAVLKPVATE